MPGIVTACLREQNTGGLSHDCKFLSSVVANRIDDYFSLAKLLLNAIASIFV